MNKTRIVIIEDEFFAADHLAEEVKSFGYDIAGIFHSGEDFIDTTDWQFDLAIIDIFLSEKLTGLDIAGKLNERHKPFIFLTANQDPNTLKNAARLAPKAYLSKPFKTKDVEAALQIIKFSIPDKIEIQGTSGKEQLNPSGILFIQSDGAYIEIKTHAASIVQRKSLKDILEELPDNFIRVHRSYIVNQEYIEQRLPNKLIVKGFQIPISRNYKVSET